MTDLWQELLGESKTFKLWGTHEKAKELYLFLYEKSNPEEETKADNILFNLLYYIFDGKNREELENTDKEKGSEGTK